MFPWGMFPWRKRRSELSIAVFLLVSLGFAAGAARAQVSWRARPLRGAGVEGLPVVCTPDPALDRVARLMLDSGVAGDSESLEHALRFERTSYPMAELLMLPHGLEGEDRRRELSRWINLWAHRMDAEVFCGKASAARGAAFVVAQMGGRMEVKLRGRSPTVRGRLAPAFSRPEVYFIYGTGVSAQRIVTERMLREGLEIPGVESLNAVQLVAWGPGGPRVVNGYWKGAMERPRLFRLGTNARSTVNSLREAFAVQTLRWSPSLNHAARLRARELCDLNAAQARAHHGTNPVAYLHAHGLRVRTGRAFVGRANREKAAVEVLFRDPVDRFWMTLPQFSDAGYGGAVDSEGRFCSVLMLVDWPESMDRLM